MNLNFKKIFLIFAFLNFSLPISHANIFEQFDLVPISDIDYYIEQKFSSNFKIFNNLPATSFKQNPTSIKNFKTLDFGFLRNNNNNLGINLKIFSNDLNRDNAMDISKISGFAEFDNNFKFLSNLNRKISLKYSNIAKTKFDCFETDTFSVGGLNSCRVLGKTFYTQGRNTKEYSSINGKSLSFGIGLLKRNYNFDHKDTIFINLDNALIKYNTFFDKSFNNVPINYKSLFPQSKIWISNDISFGFTRSYLLNNRWGLGNSLTFYKSFRSNFENKGKNFTNNLKFESKLSKIFYDNIFISTGFFITSNYLLGIEPVLYNQLTHDLYNSQYSEFYLNIGAKFNNHVFDSKNQNTTIISELFYKNLKIDESFKKENISTNMNLKIIKNIEDKKNKYGYDLKKDLTRYALDFAKKHDETVFLFN